MASPLFSKFIFFPDTLIVCTGPGADVSFVFRLTNYLFYTAGNVALAAIAAGPIFNSERDGMVLEATSDFLDQVSGLKAKMKV